jgi:Ca2+-binding RTX toxin-like protein
MGGLGNDVYYVNGLYGYHSSYRTPNTDDSVIELEGGGYDTIYSNTFYYNMPSNVESLVDEYYDGAWFSTNYASGEQKTFGRYLNGNDSNNLIRINGSGLNKGHVIHIDGGAGADTLMGGDEATTYVVDDVGDVIIEGEKNYYSRLVDTVETTLPVYTLGNNLENLVLTGDALSIGIGNDVDNFLDGTKNKSKNVLIGGKGNDTYILGDGDIAVETFDEGVDTMIINPMSSQADENSGNFEALVVGMENSSSLQKTVFYLSDYANIENISAIPRDSITYSIIGTDLDNILTYESDSNYGGVLNGGGGSDQLKGGEGADILDGGEGGDYMAGGSGEDTYRIDNILDKVYEQPELWMDGNYHFPRGNKIETSVDYDLPEGVNQMIALVGGIKLTGNDVENWLSSGETSVGNALIGGGGDDILVCGQGNDTLMGGVGSDNYQINLRIGNKKITIVDTDAIDGHLDQVTFDITQQSMRWFRDADDLLMELVEQVGEHGVVVKNFFATINASTVRHFQFADGLKWTDIDFQTNGGQPIDPLTNAPQLTQPVADIAVNEDTSLQSINIAAAFTDPQGLALTYSLRLANGQPLPDWIKFDAATGRITGQPVNDDVKVWRLMASATNTAGLSMQDAFDLTVVNVNDAPVVTAVVQTETVVDAGTTTAVRMIEWFTDVDADDHWSLSVVQADGQPLPDWMQFDPQTWELTTAPSAQVTGTVNLLVTATDLAGSTATSPLAVKVRGSTDLALTGTAGGDVLTGGAGNDTLDGGLGADAMTGGAGDDTYVVDNTGDTVIETANQGIDRVRSSVNYVLPQHTEQLTLTGDATAGTGNDLDNLLFGNALDNVLDGAAGNDTLDGGAGADALYGGSGNDDLTGGAGADLLAAGAGDDLLAAGDGVNVLIAGAGNDRIAADGGNDFIDAGAGDDVIAAGGGSNFIAPGRGNDTIRVAGISDVIAFNRGDGADTFLANGGQRAVLSLGGKGMGYADWSLRKTGLDLVLDMGQGDSVTLKDWYLDAQHRNISTLQVVAGTQGIELNANTRTTMNFRKAIAYDFAALVNQFDQARAADSALSVWAVADQLSSHQLKASNTQALGGDMAYRYATDGMNGSGNYGNLDVEGLRSRLEALSSSTWQNLTAPGGPTSTPVLDPWTTLQAGLSLMSSGATGLASPMVATTTVNSNQLAFAALNSNGQALTWMQDSGVRSLP